MVLLPCRIEIGLLAGTKMKRDCEESTGSNFSDTSPSSPGQRGKKTGMDFSSHTATNVNELTDDISLFTELKKARFYEPPYPEKKSGKTWNKTVWKLINAQIITKSLDWLNQRLKFYSFMYTHDQRLSYIQDITLKGLIWIAFQSEFRANNRGPVGINVLGKMCEPIPTTSALIEGYPGTTVSNTGILPASEEIWATSSGFGGYSGSGSIRETGGLSGSQLTEPPFSGCFGHNVRCNVAEDIEKVAREKGNIVAAMTAKSLFDSPNGVACQHFTKSGPQFKERYTNMSVALYQSYNGKPTFKEDGTPTDETLGRYFGFA